MDTQNFELPVSDSIRIRPVYLRYLARKHHMQPGPPNEDEKRDAIKVLRECYPPVWAIDELLLAEAERIFTQDHNPSTGETS